MAIKAAWTLAILVALILTAVPQVRAGQTKAITVPSSCNTFSHSKFSPALFNMNSTS